MAHICMKRRELLSLLGAGAITAWPLIARAQQKTMPVIGFLGATSPESMGLSFAGFIQGLNESGFVDGQSVAIEYRWADGRYDRLPAMAADLVGRQPSALVAATLPAALAAKAATTTIPIVFFSGGDPVEQGLVASFSRPGGNLTGASLFINDLGPKRLDLLRDLAPGAVVVGYLANPDNPNYERQLRGMREAAKVSGRRIVILDARSESEIDAAFAALAAQHGDGLIVGADPFFGNQRGQLVALAASYGVPAIHFFREFATAGGLISYGTSLPAVSNQAGIYVGKILKGAKPADLPVQQPTKFELVINLKTAKALGLTIPPTLLARADDVIE